MATIVTKSIGSAGGRDYATIAAFLDAVPANLVSVDEAWVGELYNDSEFSVSSKYTLSAKTTSTSCYIKLKAASGQSFRDHANKLTNALRYNQANGVGVTGSLGFDYQFDFSAAADFIIEGLQLKVTNAYGKLASMGTRAIFRNNIVQTLNGNSLLNLGADAAAYNNVIYYIGSYEAHCFNLGMGTAAIRFNTLYALGGNGSGRPVTGYTNDEFKNCIHIGFPQDPSIPIAAYNATDDATTIGTNNVLGITAAATWESVTTNNWDFRVKAGASVINAGTPISGITEDILGQTRSATTPTIGAFEVVSSGSATGDGHTGTIAVTGSGGGASGTAGGDGTADGHAATIAVTASGGGATGAAGASFTIPEPLYNNTLATPHAGVTVHWSWYAGGRIGSLAGITPVEGSAVTNGSGLFTASGLTAGAGVLLFAYRRTGAADDDVAYVSGTAA